MAANNLFYIGVNGVAEACTPDCIGVDGVARKVQKIYAGVDGTAKLVYERIINSEDVSRDIKYMTPVGAYNNDGVVIGDHMLIAGGEYEGHLKTVDAYDSSLTRTALADLDAARTYLIGGVIGDYALFNGGMTTGFYFNSDVYDKSLTKQTSIIGSATYDTNSVNIKDELLIFRSSEGYCAFNKSLTRTIVENGSAPLFESISASVGDYAIFSGGISYLDGVLSENSHDTVEVINSSLTLSSLDPSEKTFDGIGMSLNDHALIAGGYCSNIINVYDASLTKKDDILLDSDRCAPAAGVIDNCAIIASGYSYVFDEYSYEVNMIDSHLTMSSLSNIKYARLNAIGVSFCDMFIIVGGIADTSSRHISYMEVYKINATT